MARRFGQPSQTTPHAARSCTDRQQTGNRHAQPVARPSNINTGCPRASRSVRRSRSGFARLLQQLALALLCGTSVPAAAADAALLDQPFSVRNLNPFIAPYGLPRYAASTITAPGAWAVGVDYAVASSFDADATTQEAAIIDGETEVLTVRALRGLPGGWEVGVDLPLMRHSGGRLDSLIIDWHDLFGLPQNGRDRAPTDRLAYVYRSANANLQLARRTTGVGDVQLLAGRSLPAGSNARAAVRAHVKVPTGDEDRLFGSGGVDAGVSAFYDRQVAPRWNVGVSAGLTALSDRGALALPVRPLVADLSGRVSFRATPAVRLKVMWGGQSPVFDRSRLPELNEVAYLLTFGATVRVGASAVLDIVAVENFPHPQITPDITFQLAWRARF